MAEGDPTTLRHLFPKDTRQSHRYQRPSTGGGSDTKEPPERDPVTHAQFLSEKLDEVSELAADAIAERTRRGFEDEGVIVSFEVETFDGFSPKSFEHSAHGPFLLSYKESEGRGTASVYVQRDEKFDYYRNKVEKYRKSGEQQNLLAPIVDISLGRLRELWTDPNEPPTDDTRRWWEVWMREADEWAIVRDKLEAAGLEVSEKRLRFPGRFVAAVAATPQELDAAIENVPVFAEIRRIPPIVGDLVEFPPREQRDWADDLLERISYRPDPDTRICVLDTGVDVGHPLLEGVLAEDGFWSYRPHWRGDPHGHGTQMAGLGIFGLEFEHAIETNDPVEIQHKFEAAAIIHENEPNPEDTWGAVTQAAADAMESVAPAVNRVFNLSIGGPKCADGTPTSWSAAIDQLAAGADSETSSSRLFIVAAGNVSLASEYSYPDVNYTETLEDPAQAWNALSVGAYTQRDHIDLAQYPDYRPVGCVDDMSPYTTTGVLWLASDGSVSRPTKPDLVMEGGNAAVDGMGFHSEMDSLSLLTTESQQANDVLFTSTAMTSAATALVSKMAAEIWTAYPNLRPETVRALLIHSARWTPQMKEHFADITGRRERRRHLLHCFGYGVPSLERAVASAKSATTMIVEDEIQPFIRERNNSGAWSQRAHEVQIHTLPWPDAALEEIATADTELRITLSYFIEPNPGKRGWKHRYSYASHQLRVEIAKPGESLQEFKSRINELERREHPDYSSGSDADDWGLWDESRRGSIHSDWWTGSAADLLNRRYVAVTPVTGWWKQYNSLKRWDSRTSYSLVVSIESRVQADLYTEIAQQIGIAVAPEIFVG